MGNMESPIPGRKHPLPGMNPLPAPFLPLPFLPFPTAGPAGMKPPLYIRKPSMPPRSSTVMLQSVVRRRRVDIFRERNLWNLFSERIFYVVEIEEDNCKTKVVKIVESLNNTPETVCFCDCC